MLEKIKSPRFKELDSLRGLAALIVVLFHFTMGRPEGELGFRFGVTGVDLFFIISGFVIFMSISKVSSTREFAISRISRLYPTYWACVVITFISILIFQPVVHPAGNLWIRFVGNLTMFQYYLKIPNLDDPYWTMIVEMVFYIFIACLYRLGLLRRIIPVSILLLSLVLATDLWLEPAFPLMSKIGKVFPLFNHFPLFFAGILFYRILFGKLARQELFLAYFLVAITYGAQLFLFDNAGCSRNFVEFGQYSFLLLAYYLLFVAFVQGFLAWTINPVSLFLGKISYALYLVHQLIGISIIIPRLMKDAGFAFWPAALVALVVVLLLATIITYFIEVPFSKLLNQRLRIILRVAK